MSAKLHLALLLAGTRAAIERTAIYVEIAGEGFALSTWLPARGSAPALRVAPDGAITQYPGRAPRGNVSDLLSPKEKTT